jgi:hypothetical protein
VERAAVISALAVVLGRLDLPLAESWGILALHLLAVASFASLMIMLIGRWALLPTWLFFVVLGNSSSGGAVSPPLLPRPFALISQWLPSGATVTALRDATPAPSEPGALVSVARRRGARRFRGTAGWRETSA